MKRAFLIFVLSVLVIAATAVAVSVIRNQRAWATIRQEDAQLVAEVENALIDRLETLPADDEVTKRYGKFVRLIGTGHQRIDGMTLVERIDMPRHIKFEKAEVRCSVMISNRGPMKLTFRMYPSSEWMDKHPNRKLDHRGASLAVVASHPNLVFGPADRQHLQKLDQEVSTALVDFVAGVTKKDSSASTRTAEWFHRQRRSEPIERFVADGLEHENVDVRVAIVRLVGTPTPGQRLSYPPGVLELLLGVVEDESAELESRREAVRAILPLYERDRTKLYQRLEKLGTDAHFASPVIAEFIVDRSQRNWRTGGGFDAPTGAIELLGSWGPAASETVPALMTVLEEHPNRYEFAPAAATALGRIGSAAKSAVPSLMSATRERYSNLRAAAEQALQSIPHDPEEFP